MAIPTGSILFFLNYIFEIFNFLSFFSKNNSRSPWSNKYDPPLKDGAVPSASLRQLELQANEVFDTYRDLYFEGGVSSVYCWDLDSGFAAVVLIKKSRCQNIITNFLDFEFLKFISQSFSPRSF